MRRTLLFVLVLAALPLAPRTSAPVQAQATVRTGSTTLTSVQDWQLGARTNLLVSNNDGGELRLDEDSTSGEFVSAPIATSDRSGPFSASAVGATWDAQLSPGTSLSLDVRGGASPDGPWGNWQPLIAGDARAAVRRAGELTGLAASETQRVLPPDSAYVQVRAAFASDVERASAILNELTLHYANALEGPSSAVGLNRTPVAYGSETLTPRPLAVRRAEWSRQELDLPVQTVPPKAIILHQTGSLGSSEILTTTGQPLMVLRALEAYQRQALGWSDLIYHFVIDRDGNLYEGRQNGPSSVVTPTQLVTPTAGMTLTQLLGIGEPAVHIALLSDFDEAPTPEARLTLARLVAWLGEAYRIPPLGEHRVRLPDGSVATRSNFLAHSELTIPGFEAGTTVPAAPDPGEATRNLMPELRQEADAVTVRSRSFFPEGNTREFEERIALFNPGDGAVTARVLLLRQGQAPALEEVVLEPNSRADVIVNELLPDAADAAAVVEANQTLVAERIMRRTSTVDGQELAEIDGDTGLAQLSRVWYFAEGSTDDGFETYFSLLNPRSAPTDATLTYNLGDGRTITQTLTIPALSRSVVKVSELDAMKGVGFGTRVLADAPIAAERTMTFGAGGQGFHLSGGNARLAERWYFAEGTTEDPFEMRILLLNPGLQAAEAELTFATPDGTSLARKYVLPPTSRLVVDVNDVVPTLGVATSISSDRPILAERALYFNEGKAGTATMGATEPAFSWRFADGRTTEGDEMFLVIANPGEGQALVTAEFVLEDGSVETQGLPLIPAGSRYALVVHELYPGQSVLAATIRATQPVVVERSLFRDERNGGGFTTLGVPGAD
jgi:hypothetical protein